jgi:hypothetical protein
MWKFLHFVLKFIITKSPCCKKNQIYPHKSQFLMIPEAGSGSSGYQLGGSLVRVLFIAMPCVTLLDVHTHREKGPPCLPFSIKAFIPSWWICPYVLIQTYLPHKGATFTAVTLKMRVSTFEF